MLNSQAHSITDLILKRHWKILKTPHTTMATTFAVPEVAPAKRIDIFPLPICRLVEVT